MPRVIFPKPFKRVGVGSLREPFTPASEVKMSFQILPVVAVPVAADPVFPGSVQIGIAEAIIEWPIPCEWEILSRNSRPKTVNRRRRVGDREGKIAVAGGQGPGGFKPSVAEATIRLAENTK